MAERTPCPYCSSVTCDTLKVAICRGCSTVQCFQNGLGRGCCAVCSYGILPGWFGSDGTCSYKGCVQHGDFAYVRGKRYVCKLHAQQAVVRSATKRGPAITLASYVQHSVEEARKVWNKPWDPDKWRVRGVRALPAQVTP